MRVKVAELIANFMADKGIDTVFTLTGGGAMHLNDALGHNERLHCVYNHHEQGCSIAAEGYFRIANKPALVCVTSGPGGTNAITGVMGAWLDSIPMFVLSGQVKFITTTSSVPHLKLRQLGDQEFNICESVRNMTKYATMVKNSNEILYHLEKAWALMNDHRMGPVWLDIPLDVQGAMVETDELIHFDIAELPKPDIDEFTSNDANKILSLITEAKKPVLLAGSGIRLSNSVDKFIKFAEMLNIPVVTPFGNHDLIEENHPLYCGRPGIMGLRGGNFVVQDCDLLLSIGSQLSIRQVSYNWENFAPKAKIISVDFDRDELRKPTLNIDYPICADLRTFMDVCLGENVVLNNHAEWLTWCKKVHQQFPATQVKNKSSIDNINPYEFFDKLSDLIPEGEVMACANGTACVVTSQAFKFKKHQRMYINSGCASMGYGFPAAIGSCLASNGKRVICIDGDGSLMMNVQEMMTASYNNLNLKLILLNNQGYHSIRQTQSNLFKQHPMCGVSRDDGVGFPSFKKLADTFNFKYYFLNDINDINDTLEKFLNTPGCVFMEVMIDPSQFFEPKLSAKVLPDGKIVSPPIQDMFPFLDRETYESIKFDN